MTTEDLLIDALAQSEAEAGAFIDELLHENEILRQMISVLLEQLQLALLTKSYQPEVRH